jgi:hypothetical protein
MTEVYAVVAWAWADGDVKQAVWDAFVVDVNPDPAGGQGEDGWGLPVPWRFGVAWAAVEGFDT